MPKREITTEDALRMMRKMEKLASSGGGTSGGGYGFYSMEVDENGNLWAVYPDGDSAPPFDYDAGTGNLYIDV